MFLTDRCLSDDRCASATPRALRVESPAASDLPGVGIVSRPTPRGRGRVAVPTLAVVFVVVTAGCAGFVGGGSTTDQPDEVPQAPTPSPTPTAAAEPATTTGTLPATPSAGADGAEDDDGLAADRERILGTDPQVADTDGDGLDDGTEVAGATDPLVADTDGDGLDDGRETALGTDPLLADTDDDGLDDAREVAGVTDPLVADTDGDGALDGAELEAGLDPLVADTDGDGLADGTELDGPSDPLVADTDGDGLDDAREAALGTDPTVTDTDGDGLDDAREADGASDPTLADTDDDGLGDAREVALGTDANDSDTDGDGLVDGWEVDNETPSGAALPGADPLHKDLYVLVSRADEAYVLRESDRAAIAGRFAQMGVDNPDGDRGIDVHFVRGEWLPIRSEFTDRGAARRALRENSTPATMGTRHGVYHHVIVMQISDRDDTFDGYATSGGRGVLVDEDERDTRNGTIAYRNRLVIRGLLQNVLGRPDEELRDPDNRRFTRNGWTARDPDDLRSNEYLPIGVQEVLEREGFATASAPPDRY